MCFYCGEDVPTHDDLRTHTETHQPCSERDRAIKLVKASDAEVKIDVSDIHCKVCDENFPNLREIVSHLRMKHKLDYNEGVNLTIVPYRLIDLKCIYCEESFDFFGKLISHTNSLHPTDCFVCDDCGQTFNKRRDLQSHTRWYHKNEYRCSKCSQSFMSNAALQNHKANEHVSTCNVCLETFSSTAKRLKHMKQDHDFVTLQCGLCKRILSTKQAFFTHATRCGKNMSKERNVEYAGAKSSDEKRPCVKKMRNNIACILNMSTAILFKYYMNKFRCFYCPKDFVECEDLRQHTILEHPMCDTRFKSMQLRHRKEDGVKVDTSSLSCKLCFEQVPDLDILINHLISEHKAKYDKSVPNILQPYRLIKDNYCCPECGQSFRYFGMLLRHVGKEHTGNRKVCIYCGKCFRTDPNLRAHISRHHTVAKHRCAQCDAEFAAANDLQLHLGAKHGVKVAQCPECHEKFISQYRVQRHMINMHGVGHKCTYCGKLFTKHSFMTSHVRRLHLKEKNVECSVCFEKFFDTQRLKMHMVKHVGERNFHCDLCGKKFLWKKNLRGHMASHNKHDEPSGPYDGFTSERRRKNLQVLFNNSSILPFKWKGKYLCFYCGQSTADYAELKAHTKSHGSCSTKDYALKIIKGNHIEIKIDVSDISCDICKEPFSKFGDIVDHLIGKHELEYDKSVDIPLQEYKLSDRRCLHCDQQFPYFGNLVSHVNARHPQNCFICNECGATYNKKRDLALHFRNNHKQGGYKCDQCSQVFETRVILVSHQNNYHFRRCKVCNSSFASYTLLQKHTLAEHPDDGCLKCRYCSRELHSIQGLKQHVNRCKVKMLAADTPPLDSNDAINAVEPRKRQNVAQIRQNIMCVLNMSTAVPFRFFAKFFCFYCSKKFIDFDELKSHTVAEHLVCDLKSKCMKKCKGERTTVKIDVSSLSCKLCCKSMAGLEELVDHVIDEHKANYDKTVTGCLDPFRMIKDNMPCPMCPKSFRYFGILLRHINSEHSGNNSICDFCGRSFKNVANLNVHISHAHTGSIECDVCLAKFRNQWCLSRHKAKRHDAKDFKCPKCPEMFQSQYHKQKHLIQVHDEGHRCSVCGRMFTRNSFMKDHIRRTHLKEKNVACSVCNERFFDNYLLRMHMVKHEGDRKYTCNMCGKSFLRKSNLCSHMEMHKKYGHLQNEATVKT